MNSQRRLFLNLSTATVATAILAPMVPGAALAADDPIYTGFFSNKAVGGYDPVAYFTESKPVKGSKKFQFEYKGADWYFKSQENLDLFKADPDKYAPQYGGYCAYAVGINQTAKGDPDHWDIVDGKLYLNYDANTRRLWKEKPDFYIEEAKTYWPSVLK